MEKFNIVSVFIFTTDDKIINLVEKSANKIVTKVTNNISYYYYIIETAFSVDELKSLLELEESDHHCFITINKLNESDFKTIKTNMYSVFLSSIDNLFIDINKCDEIQLTENDDIIEETNNVEEDSDTFNYFINELLDKGRVSEDSIMTAIDFCLDNGLKTEQDKTHYNMLVDALKKIQKD